MKVGCELEGCQYFYLPEAQKSTHLHYSKSPQSNSIVSPCSNERDLTFFVTAERMSSSYSSSRSLLIPRSALVPSRFTPVSFLIESGSVRYLAFNGSADVLREWLKIGIELRVVFEVIPAFPQK